MTAGLPVAVTEKVAVAPAVTVMPTGWTVMAGPAFTVRTAAAEVTDPRVLVTVTV